MIPVTVIISFLVACSSTQCDSIQCRSEIKYVCGSDDKTYDSKCFLKRAACELGTTTTTLTVKSRGVCDAYCDNEYLPCSLETDYVCGSDDITYDNECFLERAACELKELTVASSGACDACATTTCDFGSECQDNFDGTAQCVCPETLCGQKKPVCGSNGQTYHNACVLNKAYCESEGNITQVSDGACEGACAKVQCDWGRVCQETGETTTCECPELDYRTCPKLDYVCGSDNITYGNRCLLDTAICESNGTVTFASKGRCRGFCATTCPTKLDNYVCGSDGKTYDNRCLLDTAICETNGSVRFASEGRCGGDRGGEIQCSVDTACGENIGLVCGSDGSIYQNLCSFQYENCVKQGAMEIIPCSDASHAASPTSEEEINGSSNTVPALGALMVFMVFVAGW